MSDEYLCRSSGLDPVFLKTYFDPATQFTRHAILLSRADLYQNQLIHFIAAYTLNARHLRFSHHITLESRVAVKLLCCFLQQLNYAVTVLTIVGSHMQRYL